MRRPDKQQIRARFVPHYAAAVKRWTPAQIEEEMDWLFSKLDILAGEKERRDYDTVLRLRFEMRKR